MAFNIGFYAYAIIGHTRADQLLPQLLMEQFDILPIQLGANSIRVISLCSSKWLLIWGFMLMLL